MRSTYRTFIKGLLLDFARKLRGTNWLLVTFALPYIGILTDVHKIQWISIFPFYLCMPLTLKIDFGARFIHTTNFICIWILYADWVTFFLLLNAKVKNLQNFKTSQIFQMNWDFESLGMSPSSIYSRFLKPLSVLHARFPTKKSWVVAYFWQKKKYSQLF